MKTQKRHRNGKFISQKQWERREFRRMKMYFYSIIMAALLASAGMNGNDTIKVYRADAATTTTMSHESLCDLIAVICDNEEKVEKATRAVSDALGWEVSDETKKRIKYLYEKATEAGVPFEDAVKTIYCESRWTSTQSAVSNGEWREPSFGLAQIHLPSHPSVSKEEALDAYFSIDFLVDHWNTPQAVADKMWFGYSRNGTKNCTNGLHINF